MRIIALLATYNEERFIAACLEHLIAQGVDVYLIDNCSTDETVAIGRKYINRGLIGIETLPRNGVFALRAQLERKEQLAMELDADWFMHVDADEFHMTPSGHEKFADAIARLEEAGYNAVNFHEYTFVPTQEKPDHDHSNFLETMRWYYPFLPRALNGMRGWQRQKEPVKLARWGGHRLEFSGINIYPESFAMRHYPVLSHEHAVRKYVNKEYDADEVRAGWHYNRCNLKPEQFRFPSENTLHSCSGDGVLNPSAPRKQHFWKD